MEDLKKKEDYRGLPKEDGEAFLPRFAPSQVKKGPRAITYAEALREETGVGDGTLYEARVIGIEEVERGEEPDVYRAIASDAVFRAFGFDEDVDAVTTVMFNPYAPPRLGMQNVRIERPDYDSGLGERIADDFSLGMMLEQGGIIFEQLPKEWTAGEAEEEQELPEIAQAYLYSALQA